MGGNLREGRGGERGDDALARGCSEGHLRTRHARWDFEYPTAVDGLDFIQNMDNKFVELLAGASVASDEETVRQNITFRYNSVKSRLALMQARLQDINALVKIKNPSLLLQLQRTPPSFPK